MSTLAPVRARLKLVVRGAVQGVGFRPFVHRLATELDLGGLVRNTPRGVIIEVEGGLDQVEAFWMRLESERPPRSFIQGMDSVWLEPIGSESFEIRASETGGRQTALVPADVATCPDCLREIFDPSNRRHRYPFTNCTHCGPRFSIIESLPYDRENTSMRLFRMCPECLAEYQDPGDRRFHAQPNACPACGPRLALWDARGRESCEGDEALRAAAAAIGAGRIVAVKGLGGFHLMVAAGDDAAVRRLRARKHREEKPFALMFPTIESIKGACLVSPLEERLLRSPEAPIVLLRRRAAAGMARSVAPGTPDLGAMLPAMPLQHLLLAEFGSTVVATSGNRSEEPICTDEHEAVERLGGIADVFLVHNRPIVRHVDDSVVRVVLDREMMVRRARGYAPLPIALKSRSPGPRNILAVGAQLKNSVALALDEQVFLSQHIGDLETEQSHAAFRRVVTDLQRLCHAAPEIVVADRHPDYLSTKFAASLVASSALNGDNGPRPLGVQHHVAHVLSCMADNELEAPVLGVAWDGTGYGLDGSIWGGEFFHVTEEGIKRVAQLRPFRLPGGDRAIREPRRAALGLLTEMFGDKVFDRRDLAPVAAFSAAELATLRVMLGRGLNSPICSSAGRLFDVVASLINLRQSIRFEGQAAMELEFALENVRTEDAYPVVIEKGRTPAVIDWAPMIEAILKDLEGGTGRGGISARFHNALAEAMVLVAKEAGESQVVLSGGCFQNRYLLERTVRQLQRAGFKPYWHRRVPTNDGGIALGQVVAARRQLG